MTYLERRLYLTRVLSAWEKSGRKSFVHFLEDSLDLILPTNSEDSLLAYMESVEPLTPRAAPPESGAYTCKVAAD